MKEMILMKHTTHIHSEFSKWRKFYENFKQIIKTLMSPRTKHLKLQQTPLGKVS